MPGSVTSDNEDATTPTQIETVECETDAEDRSVASEDEEERSLDSEDDEDDDDDSSGSEFDEDRFLFLEAEEDRFEASEVDEDPSVASEDDELHIVGPQPRRRRMRGRVNPFNRTRQTHELVELRRRHEEIASLRFARVLRTGRRDAALNTTHEYFHTFSEGFAGPRLAEIFSFFNNKIDRDVFSYGSGEMGLDTWIEQCRCYTRLFPFIQTRVESTTVAYLVDSPDLLSIVETDPTMTAAIVEAQSFVDGVISRNAIYSVLPHLRFREDLVLKLLGKPFQCPSTLRFYFNSSGRLHRLDFEADFFQAFSNVEGVGLQELAEITEHVVVGDNSTLADVAATDYTYLDREGTTMAVSSASA